MSVVGIFTRSQPTIGGYLFDAILEESSELATEVTRFPIETGAIGNDHAVQTPLRLSIVVGISDNSFRAISAAAGQFSPLVGASLAGVTGEAISRVGELAAAVGLGASLINAAFAAGQATTRSQSALEAIREIQKANALIDVVASKKEYKGCLITNTRQQTSKENEQGLELVVDLIQPLIVNSEVREAGIPAPDDTAETQAQEETNLGQVSLQ